MDNKPTISLAEMRKKKKQKEARQKLPLEQRVLDLEADLIRVISMCGDLERQLEAQHNTLHKLLRLLKEQA